MRRLLLLLLLTSIHGLALRADDGAVAMRLADVCTLLSGKALGFDTVFSEQFLRQVPPYGLTTIAQQMMREAGPCTGMRIVERKTAHQVWAEAATEKGFTIPVLLTVASTPPYRIEGLFLRPPVKAQTSLNDLLTTIRGLKGRISLTITDCTKGTALAAIDSAAYLPIGSTFKLYVLGELARQIQQGTHRWQEVVEFDSSWQSLPSGRLHTWPHGSPLTLHTLASMMISESDNTATDMLIRLLGPDRIAQHQAAMGHAQPLLNQPFLTTLQAFKLKYADTVSANTYMQSSSSARSALLRHIDTAVSRNDIQLTTRIVHVDSIEWFATTAELCRAMVWFRGMAQQTGDSTALDILGINTGIPVASTWKRVAYKGGSEPGVINMTHMLQHASGTWYAVSATWMDTDSGIDEAAFAGHVEQVISMLK
jgi:beta-lactamase class A